MFPNPTSSKAVGVTLPIAAIQTYPFLSGNSWLCDQPRMTASMFRAKQSTRLWNTFDTPTRRHSIVMEPPATKSQVSVIRRGHTIPRSPCRPLVCWRCRFVVNMSLPWLRVRRNGFCNIRPNPTNASFFTVSTITLRGCTRLVASTQRKQMRWLPNCSSTRNEAMGRGWPAVEKNVTWAQSTQPRWLSSV